MAWTIDAAHSEINFTVRHMMISNVRGRKVHIEVELVKQAEPVLEAVAA